MIFYECPAGYVIDEWGLCHEETPPPEPTPLSSAVSALMAECTLRLEGFSERELMGMKLARWLVLNERMGESMGQEVEGTSTLAPREEQGDEGNGDRRMARRVACTSHLHTS